MKSTFKSKKKVVNKLNNVKSFLSTLDSCLVLPLMQNDTNFWKFVSHDLTNTFKS